MQSAVLSLLGGEEGKKENEKKKKKAYQARLPSHQAKVDLSASGKSTP